MSQKPDNPKPKRPGETVNTIEPDRPSWSAFLPLITIAAGIAAYFNSFAGVFMFDDRLHILGDRRLESLWPTWQTLTRRRPVVDFSLATNYAISGENVWGYHAFNLAIHILAALTMFGLIRRTLQSEPLRERFKNSGPWIAVIVSTLWVVHPLQTQAVTYLVQRAESMMGLFYLLTLYCVVRGSGSKRSGLWYAGAVASCAMGMGSKAVMVTAPVMVLLYDRTFLSDDLRTLLRQRWRLYVGLAASWFVLVSSGVAKGVLNPGHNRATVGFGYKGVTPLEYAYTQAEVLIQYFKLAFWPRSLCLDWFWPATRTIMDVIPQALIIGTLLLATIWLLLSRPRIGFIGAWFFIILSPTSSFIPIKDPMFEYRMYLSLAAVVLGVVLIVHSVIKWIGTRHAAAMPAMTAVAAALFVAVGTALTYGTNRRNEVYHSEIGMWQDVILKVPDSPRAAENLGTAMLAGGDMKAAIDSLRHAVKMRPNSADAHNGLGFALVARRRHGEAIESFRQAVRLKPAFVGAHVNLINAFTELGRHQEAEQQARIALQIIPGDPELQLNLANVLMGQGQLKQAVSFYRQALKTDPSQVKGWGNLGVTLLNLGRIDEAIEALRLALDLQPDYAPAHNTLGLAYANQRNLAGAEAEFQEAIKLDPQLAEAHYNLGNCARIAGDVNKAVQYYQTAVQLQPREVAARFDLGTLYAHLGRLDLAIREFETILQIAPNNPKASKALEMARQQRSESGPN